MLLLLLRVVLVTRDNDVVLRVVLVRVVLVTRDNDDFVALVASAVAWLAIRLAMTKSVSKR